MNLTTETTEEITVRSALDNPAHPLNKISFKIRESLFKIHGSQLEYLINFNQKRNISLCSLSAPVFHLRPLW